MKMATKSRLFLLIVSFLGLSVTGCVQSINLAIHSKPSDAKVIIDGKQKGKTPLTQLFDNDS